MTRARDIANLGSNPPLSGTLGTSLISAGTVSSSGTVTSSSPVTLWQPYYVSLNSVTSVSPPTTNTFQADFQDFNNFDWSAASYWTGFETAIGTVGNMTQMRIDQGGGTVHDYDVVTDYFSYGGPGNFEFTWRAYWYVGGTWNGSSGTLPAGTSADPHPDSNMLGYTVSWLQSINLDQVVSTDSNAASILTGQERFLIGASAFNVADVTLSGSAITFADSGRTFTNGDAIGYYNTPDQITATLNDGTDVILEFESNNSNDKFVIEGQPLQGLQANYYSNPTNLSGATDAGINQNYGGGQVSELLSGYHVSGYKTGTTYTLPRPNPSPKGKFLLMGTSRMSLQNTTTNWEMLDAYSWIDIRLAGHPVSSTWMTPPAMRANPSPGIDSLSRIYVRGRSGQLDVPRIAGAQNNFTILITEAPAVDLEFRVRGLVNYLPTNRPAGTINYFYFQLENLHIIEL